ncbi:hypothetical protein Q9888_002743 [Vibrio cholerae]|nr:hypothetical protein [Vibrio cholerae]
MKKYILTLIVCFLPLFTYAGVKEQKKTCFFDNNELQVGETISIKDPILESRATLAYRKQGYTQEQIDEILRTEDWTTYVLVCTNTFVSSSNHTTDSSNVAAMLEYGDPALVPLHHQVDWIDKLKKQSL